MTEKIDVPEPMDKDELIRVLRAQLVRAKHTLNLIDFAVQDAIEQYIPVDLSTGHLPFEKFINLLVSVVRREERLKWQNSEQVRNHIRQYIGDRLEEKLDALAYDNLPKLRGLIADHLTIQVLLLPGRKRLSPDGLSRYVGIRACALRGQLPQGNGPTFEAAYADLRERLTIFLYNHDQREFFYRNLSTKNREMARIFETAQPYKIDQIEDFKIEVRQVLEKK